MTINKKHLLPLTESCLSICAMRSRRVIALVAMDIEAVPRPLSAMLSATLGADIPTCGPECPP